MLTTANSDDIGKRNMKNMHKRHDSNSRIVMPINSAVPLSPPTNNATGLAIRNLPPAPSNELHDPSGLEQETPPLSSAEQSEAEHRENIASEDQQPSKGNGVDRDSTAQHSKPRKNSLVAFLTLKEPSSKALDDFAEAEKQKAKEKGGKAPATGLSGFSSQKLPDHVPKVNSKWDGLPDSARRKSEEGKHGDSSTRKQSLQSPPSRASRWSSSSSARRPSVEDDKNSRPNSAASRNVTSTKATASKSSGSPIASTSPPPETRPRTLDPRHDPRSQSNSPPGPSTLTTIREQTSQHFQPPAAELSADTEVYELSAMAASNASIGLWLGGVDEHRYHRAPEEREGMDQAIPSSGRDEVHVGSASPKPAKPPNSPAPINFSRPLRQRTDNVV